MGSGLSLGLGGLMSETETLQRSDEEQLLREIDTILDLPELIPGVGEFVIDPDTFGYMSLGQRHHIGRLH